MTYQDAYKLSFEEKSAKDKRAAMIAAGALLSAYPHIGGKIENTEQALDLLFLVAQHIKSKL